MIAARALVRVRRMPLWKSSLIAVGGLVLVGGVAIGEMAGIGQLLHIANPARHFDVFHALHNQLVVGSLIGVALLWLLPPHPWAKQVIEADPSDVDATPEVHAGWRTPGNVVALASYQGRAPPRPPDAKGVGG